MSSGAVRNVPAQPATYADLEALPEGVRAELIDGEIVTEPSPLPEHSNVQRRLGIAVGNPYQDQHGRGGPGGWWIFLEVDVRFDERRVLRPDVAGWHRERLPRPNVRPIEIAPDWVCEVISPTSRARDRIRKKI